LVINFGDIIAVHLVYVWTKPNCSRLKSTAFLIICLILIISLVLNCCKSRSCLLLIVPGCQRCIKVISLNITRNKTWLITLLFFSICLWVSVVVKSAFEILVNKYFAFFIILRTEWTVILWSIKLVIANVLFLDLLISVLRLAEWRLVRCSPTRKSSYVGATTGSPFVTVVLNDLRLTNWAIWTFHLLSIRSTSYLKGLLLRLLIIGGFCREGLSSIMVSDTI
jgi:hypothetical protein